MSENSQGVAQTPLKKAFTFSMTKLLAFCVFITSIVISAYALDLVERAKFLILYSGVSIIRFLPILFLTLFVFTYIIYKNYSRNLSWLQSLSLAVKLSFVSLAFFFAGSFYKDPWLSTTMFVDEYHGPTKNIQHYAGFEIKPKQCEKQDFELTCSFEAINLLPKDNSFGIDDESYAIDHKDSHAKFRGFYIGELRYKNSWDYFTVPKGQKRSFRVIFKLSSDLKMELAPYVSIVLHSRDHRSKHLNFSAMKVTDYL